MKDIMGEFDGELSELLIKSAIILGGGLDEFESDSCYGSYEKDFSNSNDPWNNLDNKNHDWFEKFSRDKGHLGRFKRTCNFMDKNATSQTRFHSWSSSDNFMDKNATLQTRFNTSNGSKGSPNCEMPNRFQPSDLKGRINAPDWDCPYFGFRHKLQADFGALDDNGNEHRCENNSSQVC